MKTVIATFNTQTAAKQAENELRDAGFEAVGVESGAGSDEGETHADNDFVEDVQEPLAGTQIAGMAGVNNNASMGTPIPVVIPPVDSVTQNSEVVRVTVKTEYVDKAIKIITDHGGMIDTDGDSMSRSTLDEVANAAQARNRL